MSTTVPEPSQEKVKACLQEIVQTRYIPIPEHMRPVKLNDEGYLHHVVIFNSDYTVTTYDQIRLRKADLDLGKLTQALRGWFRIAQSEDLKEEVLEQALDVAGPQIYSTASPSLMLLEPRFRPVIVVFVDKQMPRVSLVGLLVVDII